MLSILLHILLVLVAIVLLVSIVLLQTGPEGGVSSTLGNATISGKKSFEPIVKFTWWFVGIFIILSLLLAWLDTHERYSNQLDLNSTLFAPPPKPKLPQKPAFPSNIKNIPGVPPIPNQQNRQNMPPNIPNRPQNITINPNTNTINGKEPSLPVMQAPASPGAHK
jgi:protein translocase SecG subunit